MMQQLPQFDFECQYRADNTSPSICKYQSVRLGHIVSTSYIFCNKVCPKYAYQDGQEDSMFLKRCFNRRYDKDFIQKVVGKYKQKTTIIVPELFDKINKTFGCLIKNQDWFKDVGLTGSIIVDGVTNHKDIDIVIYITDIDKYIGWKTSNDLPSHIDNLKIDYYIYIDPMVQFFTSLWPNSNTIIVNKQFSNNIKVPKDYSILYNDFDFTLYQ